MPRPSCGVTATRICLQDPHSPWSARSTPRQRASALRASWQKISAHDLLVVSGLARGIDRAAHKGALETGIIAVIANGIDHSYPRENAELQKQIVE